VVLFEVFENRGLIRLIDREIDGVDRGILMHVLQQRRERRVWRVVMQLLQLLHTWTQPCNSPPPHHTAPQFRDSTNVAEKERGHARTGSGEWFERCFEQLSKQSHVCGVQRRHKARCAVFCAVPPGASADLQRFGHQQLTLLIAIELLLTSHHQNKITPHITSVSILVWVGRMWCGRTYPKRGEHDASDVQIQTHTHSVLHTHVTNNA
jgi:hypothetical protein